MLLSLLLTHLFAPALLAELLASILHSLGLFPPPLLLKGRLAGLCILFLSLLSGLLFFQTSLIEFLDLTLISPPLLSELFIRPDQVTALFVDAMKPVDFASLL